MLRCRRRGAALAAERRSSIAGRPEMEPSWDENTRSASSTVKGVDALAPV